jgi:Mg2+ and Co2+ transporter CorA
MNNIINQHVLTPEQTELAEAKTNLSNALAEVKQEMHDVEEFLQQLRGAPFCEFIHKVLEHKTDLQNYLSAAKDYMIAYSCTRQRLISFADDEDIYFIPHLLNPARLSIERIMEILNKEKDGVLKYKDQISPQTIDDVFACYYFFSTYQAELEGINKEYYKLYDAVYHSTDEGYAKRAKSETASLFDVYATKIWEILDFEVRPKARLKRIEFQFPSPRKINNKSIDNLKISILQTVQQIAPDLTEEEFTDQVHLAKYIHHKRLLHHQSNSIMAGYYQLHQLEEIKQTLLATKTGVKRGPKRCTCFDDIDKEMLREVYQQVYQQEKSVVKKHDEFAALFLIGMARDNPMYLDRKMAECHRVLSGLFKNIHFCLRTIQRRWREYISSTAEHIQTWKDSVKRIIQQLSMYNLYFQVN